MAEKRKALPKFVTPKGVLKFPRLTDPDTKFKEAGEYSTKFVIKKADAADMLAKLEPLHAAAAAEGKKGYAALPVATRKKLEAKGGLTINPLFNPVYDDQEEETDEIEFNFKMGASGVSKKTGKAWKMRPVLFDAKGTPTKGVQVWGGTIGKVSFETLPYFIAGTGAAGLGLRLNAVQVLELRGPGERTANEYGFGAEEGYEYNAAATEEAADGDAEPAATAGEKDASVDF